MMNRGELLAEDRMFAPRAVLLKLVKRNGLNGLCELLSVMTCWNALLMRCINVGISKVSVRRSVWRACEYTN